MPETDGFQQLPRLQNHGQFQTPLKASETSKGFIVLKGQSRRKPSKAKRVVNHNVKPEHKSKQVIQTFWAKQNDLEF